MKYILCFGDSNTNGCGYHTGMPRRERFNRWTGILQKNLGYDDYCLYEDGFNGRSTQYSSDNVRMSNGYELADVVVTNNFPLDLVIIMLGTNDLFRQPGCTARLAAGGVMRIIEKMKYTAFTTGNVVPKFLVVSPTAVGETAREVLGASDAIIKESHEFAPWYREMAELEGAYFFDAAPITKTGDDGVHFDDASHFALGEALTPVVKEILG